MRTLIRHLRPALEKAYGKDFETILRQQYRDGRSTGRAPETVRQGVRLGLPYLSPATAKAVIEAMWGMEPEHAANLAKALTDEKATPPIALVDKTDEETKALSVQAGRFTLALDTRIEAAFALAEQVYQQRAQMWAGLIAVGLSVGYYSQTPDAHSAAGWGLAGLIGLAAVPLAPAAKDLSSSVTSALNALGKIRGGKA